MSLLVLAMIGFLALMALIIALGSQSTRRYERAEQGQSSAAPPAAESIAGGRTT
jgi:type II secretory pathway pseudopilin PulG